MFVLNVESFTWERKIHWESLEKENLICALLLSASTHHRNVHAMCEWRRTIFLSFGLFHRLFFVFSESLLVYVVSSSNDIVTHNFTEKKRLHKSIILSWTLHLKGSLFWNYYPFLIDQVISSSTWCRRPFAKHLIWDRDKRIANTNKMSNKWNWWWCKFHSALDMVRQKRGKVQHCTEKSNSIQIKNWLKHLEQQLRSSF